MKIGHIIAIACPILLALALIFPSVLREVPTWGWLIIAILFVGACLVELGHQGQLEKFLKRGAIAMLLLIPFAAFLSLLPGEPQRDFSWWWLIGLVVAPLAVLCVIALRSNFFNQLKEMLARHPLACEQCLSPRKDLVWFEMPAGTTAGRPRRSLCPDCVWKKMEINLAAVTNPVLVAEPVRNAAGYYSLNADGIAEWWNSEEDARGNNAVTQTVLSALGQIAEQVSGQCEECGAVEANFCWIPAEAFRSKWDKFSDLLGYKPDTLLSEDSRRFLCGSCTARSAREGASRQRLRLHTVSSPSSDTLLVLPGEA